MNQADEIMCTSKNEILSCTVATMHPQQDGLAAHLERVVWRLGLIVAVIHANVCALGI